MGKWFKIHKCIKIVMNSYAGRILFTLLTAEYVCKYIFG